MASRVRIESDNSSDSNEKGEESELNDTEINDDEGRKKGDKEATTTSKDIAKLHEYKIESSSGKDDGVKKHDKSESKAFKKGETMIDRKGNNVDWSWRANVDINVDERFDVDEFFRTGELLGDKDLQSNEKNNNIESNNKKDKEKKKNNIAVDGAKDKTKNSVESIDGNNDITKAMSLQKRHSSTIEKQHNSNSTISDDNNNLGDTNGIDNEEEVIAQNASRLMNLDVDLKKVLTRRIIL